MQVHAWLPRTNAPIVAASFVARGCEWLAAQGVSHEPLLHVAGIDPSVLGDADAWLTLDQTEAFITHAVRHVDRPGKILDFGVALLFPSFGEVGFAMMTAADIGAALDVATRFGEQFNRLFSVTLTRTADYDVVRVDLRYRVNAELARVVCHLVVSTVVGLIRLGTGRPIEGIEVTPPIIKHVREPVSLSWLSDNGLVLTEGPDVGTMRIPASLARAPFIMADERAHRDFVARCEARLNERGVEDLTMHEARRQLRASGPPFLDLDALSLRMGTSARTLRRRLADEGTSFRELLDEARFVWAADALSRSDRSISEIAYELGYSAPEPFTRAFGRAVGISPTAYRKERLKT